MEPDARAPSSHTDIRLRLRILRDGQVAIGPGKVALLEAIRDSGSISAAARHLGMSYRRAWLLIDELNGALIHPATASDTGGKQGGGSSLTAVGAEIIAQYRSVEHKALEVCADELSRLEALIRS